MGEPDLVENWQEKIVSLSESKLGRPLTTREKQFIFSRGGLMALEAIEDSVRDLDLYGLQRFLNSESAE